MKHRIAALAVGLLAAVMAATLLGVGPASAQWTNGEGGLCRDRLFNNSMDVCADSAAAEHLPRGSVGWDAFNLLPNDATYVSLWRYYSPGNAVFTGRSTSINNLLTAYGWHYGMFQTYDCAQYVIGIGYWEWGKWYGTWESPPVWSC